MPTFSTLRRDADEFVAHTRFAEALRAQTILITGATGLIGATLVRCLCALNQAHALGLRLLLPVRSVEKARRLLPADCGLFFQSTLSELSATCPARSVDYIIHGAAPTASKSFVAQPVETLDAIFNGTRAVLDFARAAEAKSIVYLSSIEVYGRITNDEVPITEAVQGYVDPLAPRSSYSLGKRAAECLCRAYASEYGTPVKIARLTQTFGAGVGREDGRVFAMFARAALQKQDITLLSTGETRHNYLYTTDAAEALLTLLFKGTNGEAYNVADADNYASIREVGENVLQSFAPTQRLRIQLQPDAPYPPTTRLRLSTEKLLALGWKPRVGREEMFRRVIEAMQEEE